MLWTISEVLILGRSKKMSTTKIMMKKRHERKRNVNRDIKGQWVLQINWEQHTRLDGALSNWPRGMCPWPRQGSWNQINLKVPSIPNDYMILWSSSHKLAVKTISKFCSNALSFACNKIHSLKKSLRVGCLPDFNQC